MKEILIVLIVGFVAGILDLIPLFMVREPLYNMLSIVAFWLSASFFIHKTHIFKNGLIIALVLILPMALAVSASNPKDFFPMIFMALILGPAVGWILRKLLMK